MYFNWSKNDETYQKLGKKCLFYKVMKFYDAKKIFARFFIYWNCVTYIIEPNLWKEE